MSDFWDIAWYLFQAPEEYSEKDVAKFWKSEIIEPALQACKQCATGEELEEWIRSRELPMGKIMNCIRLVLSGSGSGLGIGDIIRFIGREEVANRWDKALAKLPR